MARSRIEDSGDKRLNSGRRRRLVTEDHLRQLEERGATRIESVIPTEYAQAVIRALPEVSIVDFSDPLSWYAMPKEYPAVIPSHHHQSQWDIRQRPRLHQAFSELWGTEMLWVTMDRVGFIPPLRRGEPERCALHWDIDPRIESRIYQAIVYLTDASPDRAPFTTVPGIYQGLDAWFEDRPDFDFTQVDFSAEEAFPFPGRSGDLVIWDSRLPHGPGINRSSLPRIMLAVTMFPAEESPLRGSTPLHWSREEQIEWWRTKRAPPWWRDVPNQRDPEPGAPAVLTELGRRLVGIEKWGS